MTSISAPTRREGAPSRAPAWPRFRPAPGGGGRPRLPAASGSSRAPRRSGGAGRGLCSRPPRPCRGRSGSSAGSTALLLAASAVPLERNVVVGRGGREGAGLAGSARRDELRLATSAPVAAAEELDVLGNDLDCLALAGAVSRVPLAPLEAAVDRDRAALREVLRAALGLVAPDRDVEVVRLVDPLAGLVLAPRVHGDPQLAERAARCGPQLRVLRQVPDQD